MESDSLLKTTSCGRRIGTVTASVLKILVGLTFIVSSVSKLISIEAFEMYVYSYGLLPLALCGYVVRLVLVLELILGAALISHRHHRFTVLMTLLFLIAFVVFLAYAHLSGRTDSCHCFGELLPFDPVQSILKNAVLIAVTLFVYKFSPTEWAPRWWLALLIYLLFIGVAFCYMYWKLHHIYFLALIVMGVMMVVGVLASFGFYRRWYVTTLLVLAPLVAVFSLAPPDSWFFAGDQEEFNSDLFVEVLATTTPDEENPDADLLADANLQSGRHVVAFFSPTCSACLLTAEKLSVIVSRHGLDEDRIMYVFPKFKREEVYPLFYEMSRSRDFRKMLIPSKQFIRLVSGSFPKVVLVENGEAQSAYGYNSLDEQAVVEFLK